MLDIKQITKHAVQKEKTQSPYLFAYKEKHRLPMNAEEHYTQKHVGDLAHRSIMQCTIYNQNQIRQSKAAFAEQ